MKNPITAKDLSRPSSSRSWQIFLNLVHTAAALLTVSSLTMSCRVRNSPSKTDDNNTEINTHLNLAAPPAASVGPGDIRISDFSRKPSLLFPYRECRSIQTGDADSENPVDRSYRRYAVRAILACQKAVPTEFIGKCERAGGRYDILANSVCDLTSDRIKQIVAEKAPTLRSGDLIGFSFKKVTQGSLILNPEDASITACKNVYCVPKGAPQNTFAPAPPPPRVPVPRPGVAQCPFLDPVMCRDACVIDPTLPWCDSYM